MTRNCSGTTVQPAAPAAWQPGWPANGSRAVRTARAKTSAGRRWGVSVTTLQRSHCQQRSTRPNPPRPSPKRVHDTLPNRSVADGRVSVRHASIPTHIPRARASAAQYHTQSGRCYHHAPGSRLAATTRSRAISTTRAAALHRSDTTGWCASPVV